MRNTIFLTIILLTMMTTTATGKYANVNGIKMYYEIHGSGFPLVLIHGGGSTITTNFSKVMPEFAKTHQVIAVELQAHGHTVDRNTPESFQQDAADVAELLHQLGIAQADILGFSNGGQTAMQMAITYPKLVHKVIIASAFYKKSGTPPGFWDGFDNVKLSDMPQLYQDAFLAINNDKVALLNMFNRDVERMRNFIDWKEEELRSIQAPTLIVAGDQDVVTPEHAAEMRGLIQHSRLAILPGTHGSYMGEAMTPDTGSKMSALFVAMVNEFLAAAR